MIRTVRIQMLDGLMLELHWSAAEQVYEQLKNPHLLLLSIQQTEHRTVIPMQNVLYIDFKEATAAEEIEREIEEKWEQIFETVHLHELVDLSSELEWYAEDAKTYVRIEGGDWELVSLDPHVAQLMFEIDELDEKLDSMGKRD